MWALWQRVSNGKVQVHQNHFHQKKIFHQNPHSSKTTFIKNHFHQKPLSSKNHFHQKPVSSKTSFIKDHFHQRPLSSETNFIRNHFHQKPFSSEKMKRKGTVNMVRVCVKASEEGAFLERHQLQPSSSSSSSKTRVDSAVQSNDAQSRSETRWGRHVNEAQNQKMIFGSCQRV